MYYQLNPYPERHTHDADELLPLGEFEYAVQSVHVLVVCATIVEYVFCAHGSHTALPDTVLNFPAVQAVHVLTGTIIVPVYPALHVHCVTMLLPLPEDEFLGHDEQVAILDAPVKSEYVFATQSVQFPVPIVGLYLPCPHAKHETPLAPGLFSGQYPALHVQFARSPLDRGDDENVGHNSHWLRFACEYLPKSHTRHDSIAMPPGNDE
jgi:hypothetical protein